ncbi:MAG: hypothetical protein HZC28_15295 [Spirochaetes bacterium]|nr:hypothetical protein [Spirochaetota bacterium]
MRTCIVTGFFLLIAGIILCGQTYTYPYSYVHCKLSGIASGIELTPGEISTGGKANYQTWQPEDRQRKGLDIEFPAVTNAWTKASLSWKADKDGIVRLTLMGPYLKENGKNKKIQVCYDDVEIDGSIINGDFETEADGHPKGWSFYPSKSKDNEPHLIRGRGVNGSTAIITWHDAPYYQDIQVKKDETITLRLKIRLADALDRALADDSATMLDLKEHANMGFTDTSAGDGKGGWSDQGPDNDLRAFDPSRSDFGGVPFRIVNPEKNGGCAVLSFRGATLNVPLTEAKISLEKPAAHRYLYLLHTTCFNQTKDNVGTVTVALADGTSRTIEIKSGRDVADWWGAGTLTNGAVVHKQANRDATVGLYLSRFDLGENVPVSAVTFKTTGTAIWIVVGATLSTTDIPLPKDANWKVTAGDQWKQIDLSEVRIAAGSALDFSGLVEAGPAGRYGRVKTLPGGALTFAARPEKPVRFFAFQILVNHLFEQRGSSLEAPTEEATRANIKEWAAMVRRQGYNMVRLQAIDLYLMAKTKNDCEFNPVNHDRFEYLVHRLKEEGIYVGVDAMSFIGYRAVGWSDGWAKAYGKRFLVDEDARMNWKTGVTAMMTHVNPYTGTALTKDPMVVYVTCFNEQDLWLFKDPAFSQPDVKPLAERQWRLFLAERYKDRAGDLANTWGNSDAASLPLYTLAQMSGGGNRAEDIARFLFKLEDDITVWYLDILKAIGYDGLTVQYDVISQYLHHAVHNRTTAVANHGYHAHPSDGSNPGSRATQDGAVKDAAAYFRSRAAARFTDRPFFITEYGTPYWHRYRHEEGLLFPAYAALQGFQAITVHAQAVVLSVPIGINDFSVGRDPVNRANQVMATMLYGRGDVATSKHLVEITVDDKWVFSGGNAFKSVDSGLSRIAYLSGLGLRYEGRPIPEGIPPAPKADMTIRTSGGGEIVATEMTAATVDATNSDTASRAINEMKRRGILPADNKTYHERGVYQSDTGEIMLETWTQRFSVVTPKSCGVAIKPGTTGIAGAIISAASSVAAAVGVGSLDGKTITESGHLLIVYATDAVNSGHETSADRVVLRNIGKLPILVETGKLAVTIRNNAKTLRCHALGMDGSRREEVAVKVKDDGTISLDVDTSKLKKGPAFYFELIAE